MIPALHLNLHKQWFDMIESNEKKEEYREITPYWCSKFLLLRGVHWTRSHWNDFFEVSKTIEKSAIDLIEYGIKTGKIRFKKHYLIIFSNGYKKNRPQFKREIINIKISTGVSDWGAEPMKKYFTIELK